MKSLVVYSSQSGNTKKLAPAVYEFIADPKDMSAAGEAPDPAGYDLIALDFWLQGGKPDFKSEAYIGSKSREQSESIFRLYTLFFQTGFSCSENVVR